MRESRGPKRSGERKERRPADQGDLRRRGRRKRGSGTGGAEGPVFRGGLGMGRCRGVQGSGEAADLEARVRGIEGGSGWGPSVQDRGG